MMRDLRIFAPHRYSVLMFSIFVSGCMVPVVPSNPYASVRNNSQSQLIFYMAQINGDPVYNIGGGNYFHFRKYSIEAGSRIEMPVPAIVAIQTEQLQTKDIKYIATDDAKYEYVLDRQVSAMLKDDVVTRHMETREGAEKWFLRRINGGGRYEFCWDVKGVAWVLEDLQQEQTKC